MAILNERIKERRLELGLTLLQLADSLNVREATVQRYESGEIKNIKHETVAALANILKCSPAYLMGWENKNPINGTQSIIEFKNPASDQLKRLQAYHKSFLKLNIENQDKATEYIEQLLIVQESKQQKEVYLNAAHEKPGATAEDKAHDDAIMEDDSEWE